jgi:hypothetical protein
MPESRTHVVTQQERSPSVISATISIRNAPEGTTPVRAISTESLPFSHVKHLVSPKPLHRRGDRVEK